MSLGSIASSFIDKLLLDPLGRVVDGVVGRSGTLNLSTRSLTSSTAESLARVGLGYSTVTAISASTADSATGGGDSSFLGFAGSDIVRAASTIQNNRNGGMSTQKYSTEVSPNRIARGAETGANLQYPSDLSKYFMLLQFKKYKRQSPLNESKPNTELTIALPIPGELRDNLGLKWDDTELKLVGDIANALQNPGGLGSEALGGAGAFALRAGRQAGGIIGDATTAVEQLIGVAPNPNISTSFYGPRLRDHTFTWTFSPRNKEESEAIQSIIYEIKKKALPTTVLQKSASLLNYPYMVDVILNPKQYYQFKTCVVENFSVNYSLNGIPAFFAGTNLPVFYSISLQLKELEYFLSDDVKNLNGDAPVSAAVAAAEDKIANDTQLNSVDTSGIRVPTAP